MLYGNFASHRRAVPEDCAAEPGQTYTASLPGGKFSVVLLRLVMQDARRPVFNVWSEVRIMVDVGATNCTCKHNRHKKQQKQQGQCTKG